MNIDFFAAHERRDAAPRGLPAVVAVTSAAGFTRRRWWRCDPWRWGVRPSTPAYDRLVDWIYVGDGWRFFSTRWDR